MLYALKQETNKTTTLNGAVTNKSTGSDLVNFFAIGGALRGNNQAFVDNFRLAFNEDEQSAIKLLFYFRDIRGGQGERDNFKAAFAELIKLNPELATRLMFFIPEFGRWDDIFVAENTPIESEMLALIFEQLHKDSIAILTKEGAVSLLAKWLPSVNSKRQKSLVNKIIKKAELTPKQYRVTLSEIRKTLNLIETQMSSGQWDNIEFGQVPSQAMLKYRQAFYKHQPERFEAWIAEQTDPENKNKTIKTATLTPVQIIQKIRKNRYRFQSSDEEQLDAIWKNLPNYVEEDDNSLVVVDTSGSMTSGNGNSSVVPIDVALSLGIYLAEKNKGLFHNHFITFSVRPELQQIKGKSIYEKVNNLENADWDGNTNLEAVFDLVLKTILTHNIPLDQQPRRIIIVSDMEFDSATGYTDPNQTLLKTIESRFRAAEVQMPELVFWNVDAKTKQFPVTKDEVGKTLVSGFNPNIMTSIMKNEAYNAEDFMFSVINSERYEILNSAL